MTNTVKTVSFNYDPLRQGLDTSKWKATTGTPTFSTPNLVFNAGALNHYGDFTHGDLGLGLIVPAAPTSGDSRKFGLAFLGGSAYAYFHIAGTVVTGECADGNGNTKTVTITWQSAWTNTLSNFGVNWKAGYVDFMVNGSIVGSISDIAVPGCPMSIYISNGNSDNLLMTYTTVKGAQWYMPIGQ